MSTPPWSAPPVVQSSGDQASVDVDLLGVAEASQMPSVAPSGIWALTTSVISGFSAIAEDI